MSCGKNAEFLLCGSSTDSNFDSKYVLMVCMHWNTARTKVLSVSVEWERQLFCVCLTFRCCRLIIHREPAPNSNVRLLKNDKTHEKH